MLSCFDLLDSFIYILSDIKNYSFDLLYFKYYVSKLIYLYQVIEDKFVLTSIMTSNFYFSLHILSSFDLMSNKIIYFDSLLKSKSKSEARRYSAKRRYDHHRKH